MLLGNIQLSIDRRHARRSRRGADNMKTGLCKLPWELLEQIVQTLKDTDIRHLRLSCRQLEARIFHLVKDRFFSTVQTSPQHITDNLRKLEELHLRDYVKHVDINESHDCADGCLPLPAQEAVGLTRDWSTHHRINQGLKVEGYTFLATLLRKRQFLPETISIGKMHHWNFPLDGFDSIIYELMDKGDITVQEIRITQKNSYSVRATIALSPRPHHPAPSARFLALRTAELPLKSMKQRKAWGRQIIYRAPNLTDLRISINRYWRMPEVPAEFQHYLVLPLPRLTRFELYNSCTTARTLFSILENSVESLKDLRFRKVELITRNSWAKTLGDIAARFTHLQQLELEHLQSTHTEIENGRVYLDVDFSNFGTSRGY